MSSAKSKTVPIGVGITDPFYRYKMQAVALQHKRRKNKTVITNMIEICKDLNRSPHELIKFLGHALSSAGSFSTKSGEYLINGTHSQESIQEKIQEYCGIFVACGLCNNPETEYSIKRDSIFLKCAACGGRIEVDATHKLCTYILTQHELSKQTRRKKKNDREESERVPEENQTDTDDGGQRAWKKGSRKKRATAQADTSTPRHGDYEKEFENPYFSTKGNPLYVGCFDRIAKASDVDESKAIGEYYLGAFGGDKVSPPLLFQVTHSCVCCHPQIYVEYAARKVRKTLDKSPDAPAEDMVSIVVSAQESAKVLFSRDQIRIFLKATLDDDRNVLNVLDKYANVLIMLTESNQSLERYLIVVLEEACKNDTSLFCKVLTKLYVLDILLEETILEWSKEEYKSKEKLVSKTEHAEFQTAAAPLIRWLEAEEED